MRQREELWYLAHTLSPPAGNDDERKMWLIMKIKYTHTCKHISTPMCLGGVSLYSSNPTSLILLTLLFCVIDIFYFTKSLIYSGWSKVQSKGTNFVYIRFTVIFEDIKWKKDTKIAYITFNLNIIWNIVDSLNLFNSIQLKLSDFISLSVCRNKKLTI